MKKTKQITTLSAAIMFALFSLNSLTGCSPDDGPTAGDTTQDDEPIEEFVQWNDYVLKSDKFTGKDFKFAADDSILVVSFSDQNIPASEFRISYNTDKSSKFEFAVDDYTPHWIATEARYIGLNVFGYSSGRGKFQARDYRPFDECKIYKHNNDWVVDFKNVVVKDLSDSTWTGKASGRLIWKAP